MARFGLAVICAALACCSNRARTGDGADAGTDDTDPAADAGSQGSVPGWELAWAVKAGGPGEDSEQGRSLTVTGEDDVLLTGVLHGPTAVFGEGTANEVLVDCAGDLDAFLARYDADGVPAWVETMGGDGLDEGFGVSAGGQEAAVAFISGRFRNTAVFGGGQPGETEIDAAGLEDSFVASYSAAGELAWARAMGGPGEDWGFKVAALADGGTLATGHFQGSAVFGAGESNETTLVSAGGEDVFVARFAGTGLLVWARAATGSGDDSGTAVAALADGSFLLAGLFESSITLGVGEENETYLACAGESSYFVAGFDAAGALAWAKDVGIDGEAGSHLVALEPTPEVGGFILGGRFRGTLTLGAGEPGETVFQTEDVGDDLDFDMFVARYDESGALAWARRPDGPGRIDHLTGVDRLTDGSVVVGGVFEEEVVFGEGEPNETVLSSAGAEDGFLAMYAPTGELRWALAQGGWQADVVLDLVALGDWAIVATGHFQNEAGFGTGPDDAVQLSSAGGMSDIFVMRLDRIESPD